MYILFQWYLLILVKIFLLPLHLLLLLELLLLPAGAAVPLDEASELGSVIYGAVDPSPGH